MTRIAKSKPTKRPKRRLRARRRPGHWLLQDAKARFSELVRKVRSEGPQHFTVHGRDEVVVIAAEEFRRLKGAVTGKALIDVGASAPKIRAEGACVHRDTAPCTTIQSGEGKNSR